MKTTKTILSTLNSMVQWIGNGSVLFEVAVFWQAHIFSIAAMNDALGIKTF